MHTGCIGGPSELNSASGLPHEAKQAPLGLNWAQGTVAGRIDCYGGTLHLSGAQVGQLAGDSSLGWTHLRAVEGEVCRARPSPGERGRGEGRKPGVSCVEPEPWSIF